MHSKTNTHNASGSFSSPYVWILAIVALSFSIVMVAIWHDTVATRNFDELMQWIRDNGGEVHSRVMYQHVSHGGHNIGGLVASADLKPGDVVLRLPRKLMLTSQGLQGPTVASLKAYPECKTAQDETHVVLAMKLGREIAMGSQSFYAPYTKMLPLVADYEDFHPDLASADVNYAFGELPLLRDLTLYHTFLVHEPQRRCFEAVLKAVDLQPLTYEHFLAAILAIKTRAFGTDLWFVPWYDLLNTVAPDEQPNIKWKWGSDFMAAVITEPVTEGSELLSKYFFTEGWDNEMTMHQWGIYFDVAPWHIYFDDAPENGLNKFGRLNCSMAATLRESSMAELDLDRPL